MSEADVTMIDESSELTEEKWQRLTNIDKEQQQEQQEPLYRVCARLGRFAVRDHIRLPYSELANIIGQEILYTIMGGELNPASKLNIDPLDGGQRWEVIINRGRMVQAYKRSPLEVNVLEDAPSTAPVGEETIPDLPNLRRTWQP